jgi:uncharacterized protein YceH (UPF0502 family)
MNAHDEPLLTAIEARVLGCLVEKEAATPESYPLTVNAAHVAANQKTARDPVMSLDPGDVHHALRQLERKGLAKQTFSSRAERFEHRMPQALGLPGPQVALLGLLLLRGAQTVNELLARSGRTSHFPDADAVRHHLDRLVQRDPALVVRIPRGPGQREDRYMHLLCGPVDVAAFATSDGAMDDARQRTADTTALEARVDALEREVAELRAQLANLQQR